MKRIAIILAALALLLSACVNPVPTPDTDTDPVVDLSVGSSEPGTVTINAQVTDDTPGPRSYEWRAGDVLLPTTDPVTLVDVDDFSITAGVPNRNGSESFVTGGSSTYTFNSLSGEHVVRGDRFVHSLDDRALFLIRGTDVQLTTSEAQTVSDQGVPYDVSLLGFSSGERASEPSSVIFTIGSDRVEFEPGVGQVLTLEGYSVNVTLMSMNTGSNGTVQSATVQAVYEYDNLVQQQQVRFTPNEGVRVSLPEGTVVEAYLIGGVFDTEIPQVTIIVNGEAESLDVGSTTTIGSASIHLWNTSGTTGARESASATITLGAHVYDIGSDGTTYYSSRGTEELDADLTAQIDGTDVTIFQQTASPSSSTVVEPILTAYSWRILDGQMYFLDQFALFGAEANNESLTLTSRTGGTYEVTYTVSDDRGNTGSESIPVTLEASAVE